MALIGIHAAYAYHHDSNLWPLLLIFASPVAAVTVTILWIVGFLLQRRETNTVRDR